MSENVLKVGVPRLGWFADGDPATPSTATMLQDDGRRIQLTIPWAERDSPYKRWFFGAGVSWGDDPDQTNHRYQVPDILWFSDVRGTVTLVGCRAAGATGMGPGEGYVQVRFAVMGGHNASDYRKINGLRSEMPGLSEWMRLRSLSHKVSTDAGGRIQALDLRLEAPEPVPLSRNLNLRIRPNFSFHLPNAPDTASVQESLQIETLVQRPRDWYDHIVLHNTVRDLVDIAAWAPFGYSGQWVTRTDDPLRVLSGDAIGERWAEARSYAIRSHESVTSRRRFLYTFEDIGAAEGVRRWARLRRDFGRGMGPILSTVEQTGTTLEGSIAQSGIGLDGIGYKLALDSGLTEKKANNESHIVRLSRIAADLKAPPPFDLDEWGSRSSEAYNGVKHANRDLPDVLSMANTLRENRLVFRLWVAGRIGVPADVLESNAKHDPMATPLIRA